jgi:hypothetical protein
MRIKNIFTSLVILGAVSVFGADEHFADVQLGYSSNNIPDSPYTTTKQASGFYFDIDMMKTTDTGLMFGLALDANTWTADASVGGVSGADAGYTIYTAGINAKVGYDFDAKLHIPIKIKAAYGYGIASQGKANGAGKQYDANLEYTFFEGIGFGIKRKHAEAEILKYDISFDSTIAYFSFPIGG